MQFFGKRTVVYVTFLLILCHCALVGPPLACGASTSSGHQSTDSLFDLSSLLDGKDKLFVPHQAKISREIFILVIWKDKEHLKALNLLKLHSHRQSVQVIGLSLANGNENGRKRLAETIENTLGASVDYYLQVDQSTFEKIGDLIGVLDLSGEAIPVAAAFEETPFTQDIGCEKIIRSLAQKMTETDTLIKLPYLAYILATEVETNLSAIDILHLYRQIHGCGADNIHRTMM